MSIASQVQRIKTNIQNLYTALEQKGATIPTNATSDNLVSCLDTIQVGGGGSSSKFGATIDNVLGDVDSNGKLLATTGDVNLNFAGVKDLSDYALYYKFFHNDKVKAVAFPDLENVSGKFGMDSCFSYGSGITVSLPKLTTVSSNYGMGSSFSYTKNSTVSLPKLTTISGTYGMSNAFANSNLTTIELPELTTISGNYGMEYAFNMCSSLTSVSLPKLNTISGTYGMYYTFKYCSNLKSMAFPSLKTLTGQNAMYCAFQTCSNLKHIYFPALTTSSFGSNTNQFNYMLKSVTGCTLHFPIGLESTISTLTGYPNFGGTNTVILYDLGTLELTNSNYKMSQIYPTTYITMTEPLNDFDVTNLTTASNMYDGCISLTDMGTMTYTGSSKTFSGYYMFEECHSLTTLQDFNASNIKFNGCRHMFYNCYNLTSVNIKTSSADDFNQMFYGCSSLVTVAGIDTSSATNMSYMFYGCTKLTTIPTLDMTNITSTDMVDSIFDSCNALTSVSITNIKQSIVDYLQSTYPSITFTFTNVIDDSNSLLELTDDIISNHSIGDYLSNWYWATTVEDLFNGSGYTGFDFSNVTNINYMFSDSQLGSLSTDFFATATTNIISANRTFDNCSGLMSWFSDGNTIELPFLVWETLQSRVAYEQDGVEVYWSQISTGV